MITQPIRFLTYKTTHRAPASIRPALRAGVTKKNGLFLNMLPNLCRDAGFRPPGPENRLEADCEMADGEPLLTKGDLNILSPVSLCKNKQKIEMSTI